jgi:hypothetical protein
VEWARDRFDEATARWCFDRLPEPGDDPGWLHGQRAEWRESGLAWDDWLRSWAQAEKLHTGQGILNGLDARFDRETLGSDLTSSRTWPRPAKPMSRPRSTPA